MDGSVTISKLFHLELGSGTAIIKFYCHPQTLSTPRARAVDSQDPLLRLFARSTSVGRKLLAQIRKDLGDVIKVCEGGLKQTNHLKSLMSHLTKGTTNGLPHNGYHLIWLAS
jgi:Dynein heavy chain C-terminal domain